MNVKLEEICYFLLVIGIIVILNIAFIYSILNSGNMFFYNMFLITLTVFDTLMGVSLFWMGFLFDKIKVVRRE